MTRAELQRAIELPAQKVGLDFESGLVDRILDHVEAQPGSLPLLEFALTQLWERTDSAVISHADYEAIGEVHGAISHRAEQVIASLQRDRQDLALRLFARLLRVAGPNEEGRDTRRRVALSAMDNIDRAVLTPFVDARLIVPDRSTSTGEETAEVAHEALLRGWKRLSQWVNDQRDFLLWRQRFGQLLDEWYHTDRNKAALLRGPLLREARQRRKKQSQGLNSSEQEFIKRSARAEWRGRSVHNVLIGLVLLAVIAYAGVELWFDSDDFRVRALVYSSPLYLPRATPSTRTKWFHVLDVAGETGKLDDEWLEAARSDDRLFS